MDTYAPSPVDPVTHASRRDIILRGLIIAPSWLLFVFWWLVVLRSLTWPEARYALLFIGIAFVIIFTATVSWIMHNRRLFLHTVPRTRVWPAVEDFTRDVLGRAVEFRGGLGTIRRADTVLVTASPALKTYAPADSLPRGGGQNADAAPAP